MTAHTNQLPPDRPDAPAIVREGRAITTLATALASAGVLLAAAWAAADPSAARIALAAVASVFVLAMTVMLLRQVAELRTGMYLDSLTGLRNRQYFDDQVAAALAISRRVGSPVTVMMVDIDRFKDVNDTYGHQAGDRLLREVSTRMLDCVRPYDTVARYGGEEFALVLPHADGKGAIAIAERLRQAIANTPFRLYGGTSISASISIGYAVAPDDACTEEDLVRRADLALYTCKRYGRNQLRRTESTDMSALDLERHRELIEALAMIVDLRDWGTGEHARQVSGWSRRLAEALGLDAATVTTVEAAALVHDIGKVGVPDGILLKPGQLDDAEWDVIRKHPGWGSDIVGRVSNLERASVIVRQHQEWVDGTGYPAQLVGDQIDIGARIIGVVDAFHAMTHERPYRAALQIEEALDELERAAGTQFDPSCVRAFAQLVRSGPREFIHEDAVVARPAPRIEPGQDELAA